MSYDIKIGDRVLIRFPVRLVKEINQHAFWAKPIEDESGEVFGDQIKVKWPEVLEYTYDLHPLYSVASNKEDYYIKREAIVEKVYPGENTLDIRGSSEYVPDMEVRFDEVLEILSWNSITDSKVEDNEEPGFKNLDSYEIPNQDFEEGLEDDTVLYIEIRKGTKFISIESNQGTLDFLVSYLNILKDLTK